jgi:hypothetical protein
MDKSDGPADDVSLKPVLDAVNRQSKNIEAVVEAKVSEKIGVLRDEIHGNTQFMKSHVKRLYGQISKRNQFQSNSFFKRLKLYSSFRILWFYYQMDKSTDLFCFSRREK